MKDGKITAIMASVDSYYKELNEGIQRKHKEQLGKMIQDIAQITDGNSEYLDRKREEWEAERKSMRKNQKIERKIIKLRDREIT